MSNKIIRVMSFFVILGCMCMLILGRGISASAEEVQMVADSSAIDEYTEKTESAISGGIDTSKADYLGLGHFYPFSTGELYYFTTSARKSYYQVKAVISAGTSCHLVIYDEVGGIAGEADLENLEYHRFTLEASKKYFLKVTGSSGATGEILVSEIEDDYGDLPEEAEKISIKKEYVVTTDCLGDVDYLKITTGNKDVTYKLMLDSVSGVAGTYELQNEAGEILADGSGETNIKKKLTVKLPLEPEKTYYLKFSSKEPYCQLLVSVSETINKYKITYHLNGGKNNKANPATYVATDTVALKSPTRKGYLFEGWFVTSNFSKAIYNIGGSGKRDYDLYAKWKRVQPGTVSIKSLTSKSIGKASLTFGAVSGVSGYQIRITWIVNGKKIIKYQLTKSTSASFGDWKQGQKYYVNVRAYAIDSCGNRVYGAYSKTKGVTVKQKVVKKSKAKKKK